MQLRVLDLFSGIGGFSLGLERAGMRTVAFCEIEPYCRAVLAKHWPGVPCYDDIRTLTAERLAADGIAVDVICGGYPCQPFSLAGKRMGAEDDRHLWPEYFRLIKELRPTWVLGENVVGHINMGLDSVLSNLEGAGYSVRTFVIPAVAVDAKHRRDRVWIVAHSERQRPAVREARGTWGAFPDENRNCEAKKSGRVELESWSACCNQALAHSNGAFGEGDKCAVGGEPERTNHIQPCRWESEPGVGRVANGIPNRAHRLRALGNAVVPQIPEIIGRAIIEAERNRD